MFLKFNSIIEQENEKKISGDQVLYTSGGKALHFNTKMSPEAQKVKLFIFSSNNKIQKNIEDYENIESNWRKIFQKSN